MPYNMIRIMMCTAVISACLAGCGLFGSDIPDAPGEAALDAYTPQKPLITPPSNELVLPDSSAGNRADP